MANVLFKKGLLKNLPAEKVAGTIYVTTDERAMYLDVDAATRIRLGDFNEIPNLNALPDVSHDGGTPNPTGLYYSIADNVLARYDSTKRKWALINPDNWFEIKSFAQSLSSTKDSSTNITTVTVNTTLTQKDEAGNQGASPDKETGRDMPSSWTNYLKFKDDGSVVTITKEDNNTIKISAKDEKVTSAEKHYKYDPSRDGSNDLTPINDTTDNNTFITGITVDDAGHIVNVKSREAITTLVTNPTLTSSATTKDTNSDANSAANIDFSISHGGTKPDTHLKVEGAGATTVATSNGGKTLKISSTDEHVTSADNHYKALKWGKTDTSKPENFIAAGPYTASDLFTSPELKPKDNETPAITSVYIDAAGHVTGIEAKKIADTHNKLKGTGTAAANTSNGENANGWKFILEDTDGNTNFTTFDPTIKYGKNSEGNTTKTIHGLGGSFTLDTYTTGEVDAKITTAIQATGAMVLKGEVKKTSDTNDAIKLPTDNISAGDTYIVTEDGATFGEDIVCEIGDLFVAKADKASGSDDKNWYYVPSGNDKHIIIEASNSVKKTVGAVLVDGNLTANVKYGSINFNSDAAQSPSLIKAEKYADSPSGDLGAQDVRFVFSMEWGNF